MARFRCDRFIWRACVYGFPSTVGYVVKVIYRTNMRAAERMNAIVWMRSKRKRKIYLNKLFMRVVAVTLKTLSVYDEWKMKYHNNVLCLHHEIKGPFGFPAQMKSSVDLSRFCFHKPIQTIELSVISYAMMFTRLYCDVAWIMFFITMTSQWAWWRLRSPASWLFTQPFIRVQIKENIKAPRRWPLCGEFTGDRWIPRTNGQ